MDLQPLLEKLATNASANGNSTATALLGSLRATSDDGHGPNLHELLAQIGSTNPTASLIIQYLTDQRAKAEIEKESVRELTPELVEEITEEASHPAGDLAHLEDPSAAVSELRDQVESMYAELKQIRDRNDALACALGACCLCWGDNPECRVCRGRGRPGFSVPELEQFREYVVPAVRRLQAQKPSGKHFLERPPSHTAKQAGSLSESEQ